VQRLPRESFFALRAFLMICPISIGHEFSSYHAWCAKSYAQILLELIMRQSQNSLYFQIRQHL
ncbi:hypothetical protein, partial [Pseudomonas amygdali]|uniref:hypothetical protein n=1 Tax=Pseudomonas amygdali TaxID=47877 RepID=UPI001C1FF60A